MNRFAKIKDIAVLNKETFKKDSFPNIIKYLDTGSLTKNKIEGFQQLNTKSEKIPSRAQRKVFTNTILYSTVRPNQEHYGIIERNFKDVVVSTGFTTIDITDENTYPKYIYYLLTQKSITDYLHTIGMNAVSSYPSISPDDIGNLKFRLPNLSTQKSIAKVLSDLDAKIELNNRINRELEAMAKTLYDYWFVQFDFPVDNNFSPSGEMSEGQRGYKASGGKMMYNAELKREIPVGWEVKTLDFVLQEFTKGITTKYVEKSNLINLNQKVNKGFSLDRQYYKYLDESIEIPKGKYAKEKDILINSLGQGTLGRIHYFCEKTNNIVVDQHLFILRVDENKITSSYLYLLLSSKPYEVQIERQITGSTGMQMLNGSNLKTFKVIVPNKDILLGFESMVYPLYKKVVNNHKQNQQLSELRDWLLPMLMNGQVTVSEL